MKAYPSDYEPEAHQPLADLLHQEIIPSVWCPGCGIGTVVNTFVEAIEKTNTDVDKICIVSGIGCTGKIIDYLKLNSIPATDGNAISSGIKYKSESRHGGTKVVVFLNDADLMAFGINDFIVGARHAVPLLVVYINNFIYIITENKALPITPFTRNIDKQELPFNIPHLAKSYGAKYIARWTPLHARRLMGSISEALNKPSFSVVEVISPCLMYYASSDKIGEKLDRMKFFQDNAVIKHEEPTENLDIRKQTQLIIGKFIDI